MLQIIPGIGRCIFKQTLILWISGAEPFPMDASCQAVRADTIPTLCFLRRLRGKTSSECSNLAG